jgi:HEXXH motif-containing protein
VAAVAGVLGGHRFDLPVLLRQGTVLLPTVGLASFPTDPWAPARLRYDGLRTEVSAGDQTVEVPPDPARDAPGWFGLRRLSSRPPGAEISVELIDVGPSREGVESTHLTRLSPEAADRWQEMFDEAWQILARHHPERAASVRSGLVSIAVPEAGHPATPGMSASMRDGFGHFIAAFNDSPLSFAETFVHEFQHSKLTALSDLAPLHDGAGDLIYFAPWRPDPRHLEGLLQGAYAFLGITDFWTTMRLTLDGSDRQLADFEFARWRHQVAEAVEVLLGSGRLTPAGVRVVERMRETAAAWLEVVVDPAAQQMADRTVVDNRLCWLLANRQPDPAAIGHLADAWLAGQPRPGELDEIAAITATDGISRASERFLLLRTRLTDPVRFADLCTSPAAQAAAGIDTATEADLAYATDDYHRAVRLSVSELAGGSQRPVADPVKLWAGLALAVAAGQDGAASAVLMRAPEVVAAVYRDVTGRTGTEPDPVALATWLASEHAPLAA